MPFFGVPIRNGLPIGLGSVAGFGVQQFDPSLLFEGGTVAGAWYDPSDLSTMFTTSAGTTPVAMPGLGSAVSVGLMLDKSQGLVLGSELVTNGDFSSGTTGWTAEPGAGVTLSAAGGVLTITQVGGTLYGRAYQALNGLTVGQVYQYTAQVVSNPSALNVNIWAHSTFAGTPAAAQYGTGTNGTGNLVVRFRATATTMYVMMWFNTTAAGSVGFSNASVKALPGNHAIAFNNISARPVLMARVNLLTYSEEFDNGAWTKYSVAVDANATTDPLGGNTADRLKSNSTTNSLLLQQAILNLASGASYTRSVYAKADAISTLTMQIGSTTEGTIFVQANLLNGTATSGGVVEDAGNGWWRISRTFTMSGTTNDFYFVLPTGTPIGNGVFLWGADLRPANIGVNVPAYQRIADANTYDTSGFPLYLLFEGAVGQRGMYTPANLNLSGTDKVAVFAGVRKLAAGTLQLVEFSADTNTNNGVFSMPQDVGTNTWTFVSKGTTAAIATSGSLYASPITVVNTGIGNISAPAATLRSNGAQVANITTSQGSGNFGTYPLYIGSRGNSSLWFNGHLHSLIIAGSAVSAGNISATEQWVAGKTGIQI